MKAALYKKNNRGKCKAVGVIRTETNPIVGHSITSDKGSKYKVVNYSKAYDRNGNLEGFSIEVKPI